MAEENQQEHLKDALRSALYHYGTIQVIIVDPAEKHIQLTLPIRDTSRDHIMTFYKK